jgi:hypothetical protein
VWLLLSAWTGSLYLRAALAPPPGRVFAGTFHWIDDFYNYASYIQQAEDGAFFFRNKLLEPEVSRPELVNLEWWLLGRLSLGLGRRPFLAYRLFALVGTAALVAAVARWLERAGLPHSHRLPALCLVFLGGGLGGLLFEFTDLPVWRCGDMAGGLYPFMEILANPHFVAGSALFLWALYAFMAVPAPAGPLLGVGLGTALGLVRPYDLALLGLVRGLGVVATEPKRRVVRSLLPLVGLVPVLAYDLWVFFGSDQFAPFRSGGRIPPLVEFVPAVAPALLLAALAWSGRAERDEARTARAHLGAWVAVALAVIVARAGHFSLQFLVGAGTPMLMLGAIFLARFSPRATVLATLALASTTVAATRVALDDDPNWFVPRPRMAAALALRESCRSADVVFAPPDIGLYAIALSACHAVVAHPAQPDYARRLEEAREFYEGASPAERAAWLDERGVTHLVLPGDLGPRAVSWLGPRTPFARVGQVGPPASPISVYARRAEGATVDTGAVPP